MYTYQNNTSFQENIASETVNDILKSLCNKISFEGKWLYSKQDPDLVTQLAVQNEIVPGQRKMEDNTNCLSFQNTQLKTKNTRSGKPEKDVGRNI